MINQSTNKIMENKIILSQFYVKELEVKLYKMINFK